MTRIFLAFLLCGIIACSDNIEVPEGVLPPEQMQKVMWDIVRADEWVNFQSQTDTALKRFPRSVALYQTVFQTHHTSESQFKASFKYYEKHPDLMKIVLDSMETQANRKPLSPAIKPVS